VTLLGDAAHLMSPFAGAGANLALYDGSQLATAIADSPDDLEAALAAYEADLFERAEEAADESARSLQVIFAPDAPYSLVEMFAHFGEDEPDGPLDARAQRT
jgi:2-polyprenyl-6-methoxyphenol hydroxylase-like FAD-dependent oxidoreductase